MVVEVVGSIPEVTGVDLETIPADDTAVVVEIVGIIVEETERDSVVVVGTIAADDTTVVVEVVGSVVEVTVGDTSVDVETTAVVLWW